MHVNRKSTFVRCPVREIISDPVFAGFCTGLFLTVYIILNQDKKTPPRRAANIKTGRSLEDQENRAGKEVRQLRPDPESDCSRVGRQSQGRGL